MMNEARGLGVVLGLLLVLAYLSWHQPDVPTTNRVVLVDMAPDAIESIRLTTRTATVDVSMQDDGTGRYAWVDLVRAGNAQRFVAGSRFDAVLEAVASLKAERSLGKGLGEDLLDKLGLVGRSGALVVTGARGETRLVVGERTNGRTGNFYVQQPGRDEVLLVSGDTLGDLQLAQRFRQRTFRDAKPEEIARITIVADARSFELLHRNAGETDAFWARAEQPGVRDESATSLVDATERLSVISYPEEPPAPDSLSSLLTLAWLGTDGEDLGRLEMAEQKRGAGDETIFARSPLTHRWAKVSPIQARRVLDALAEIED